MLCPSCHKEKAGYDKYFGYLPCKKCLDKQITIKRPGNQAEFVGEDIKDQRKAHLKDILPAHRKGQLDKGFVEKYGKEKAKRQGFTEEEIEKAQYVWDGDDPANSYYKKGN